MHYTITLNENEIIEAIVYWLSEQKEIREAGVTMIYPGMSSDDPRDGSSLSAKCKVIPFKLKGDS